ncbi:MAG: hypothetical protein ACPF9D_11440, partial [Owenweeksia sp.]
MKKLLLLLILITSGQVLTGQKIDFEEVDNIEDYQEWIEEVRRDSSMLFIVLWDRNDVAWQRMEAAEALDDAAFIASVTSYKALKIPITSEMGARWVQLFPANQLPAFYFLQEDELLLQIRSGYQTSAELREAALKAKSLRGKYQELANAYGNSNLSNEQWKDLLYIHSLNFSFKESLDLALEFLNGKSETLEKPRKPPKHLLRHSGG